MRLWLLRPKEGDELWEPWYDKAFGFVVRAESEAEARSYAQEDGGDETKGWSAPYKYGGKLVEVPVWTSPEHSTCVPLACEGEAGVVMCDFAAA